MLTLHKRFFSRNTRFNNQIRFTRIPGPCYHCVWFRQFSYMLSLSHNSVGHAMRQFTFLGYHAIFILNVCLNLAQKLSPTNWNLVVISRTHIPPKCLWICTLSLIIIELLLRCAWTFSVVTEAFKWTQLTFLSSVLNITHIQTCMSLGPTANLFYSEPSQQNLWCLYLILHLLPFKFSLSPHVSSFRLVRSVADVLYYDLGFLPATSTIWQFRWVISSSRCYESRFVFSK